jgi:hypothetical protein
VAVLTRAYVYTSIKPLSNHKRRVSIVWAIALFAETILAGMSALCATAVYVKLMLTLSPSVFRIMAADNAIAWQNS